MSRFDDYIREKRFILVEDKEHSGIGALIGISKTKATIAFENEIVTKIMPDDYDYGNFTILDKRIDDNFALRLAAGMPLNKTNLNYKEGLVDTLKEEFNLKKTKKKHHLGKYDKVLNHGLFGCGVGDIDIKDPRDMIDIMAFLAMPGNHFIADVPPARIPEFEEMFPNCPHYGIATSRDKLANGGSCQFTLHIPNAKNIPFLLGKEVLPSDSEKTGKNEYVRVIRTGFTFDLAENYGFQFEQDQDIERIRNYIPQEYQELFQERLEAYGYEPFEEERDRN